MEKEAELTHEKEAELTHKEEPELTHEIEITQNKKSKAMMHLDKMEADQLKAIDTLTDNHLKNLAKLEEMMLNHFPDELLDQEAVRFQKDGWEIFNIHRELMKKAQIKEAQKQAIERSKNKIPSKQEEEANIRYATPTKYKTTKGGKTVGKNTKSVVKAFGTSYQREKWRD